MGSVVRNNRSRTAIHRQCGYFVLAASSLSIHRQVKAGYGSDLGVTSESGFGLVRLDLFL